MVKGISVIIPTLNRTDYVLDTLNDLLAQQTDFRCEVVVVDQSNRPDLQVSRLAAQHPKIKYHHTDQFKGLPEARNYGASVANFDQLLFLDDDIRCKPDLLQHHLKALAKQGVAVVAGGITEKFKANRDEAVGKFKIWTATPTRGYHKTGDFEVDHAGGGNFSVDREVFNQVGGIDEHLTEGAALYEETDFCLRVKESGYRVWYVHKAHVEHLAADTGGCRIPDIEKYIYSLCRNRSVIISRHLAFYQRPVAYLYLLKLVLAYMVEYRKPSLLFQLFTAILKGRKLGKLRPKNSFLRVP